MPNVYSAIVVIEPKIVTLLMFSQLLNAPLPKLVTEAGIIMFVNDKQLPKAYSPIVVTPLGISTF